MLLVWVVDSAKEKEEEKSSDETEGKKKNGNGNGANGNGNGNGGSNGKPMAEEYRKRGVQSTKSPSIAIIKGFSQRAHCRGRKMNGQRW